MVAGFAPGSGDTTWVYDTTASVSGLTESTAYDFYLTKVCGAGNSSSQVGPVSATTLCGPNPYTAPYYDDLESGISCWSGVKTSTSGFGWTYDNGGTGSFGTGPNTGNSGDYYIYLETSGGSQGDTSYASPKLI